MCRRMETTGADTTLAGYLSARREDCRRYELTGGAQCAGNAARSASPGREEDRRARSSMDLRGCHAGAPFNRNWRGAPRL